MKCEYYTKVLGEASSTGLKHFRVSPLEYLEWINGGDEEESDSMHEGSAFHMALHEPEKFSRTYIEIPSPPFALNSKAKKLDYASIVQDTMGIPVNITGDEKAEDVRDAIKNSAVKQGRIVLESESLATLRAMVRSLNLPCHSLARRIVANGTKELELRWIDKRSGIPCKARLDSWHRESGIESDLKRTDSITLQSFTRQTLRFDYHYQRAFYRRALRENGETVNSDLMVCGSPEAPFHWAVYDLPDDVLDACDDRISEDLVALAECMTRREFPTINNGKVMTLNIKASYI